MLYMIRVGKGLSILSHAARVFAIAWGWIVTGSMTMLALQHLLGFCEHL